MTRLEGDRFALVAFEGEAYPLAPLTLDADAVGLFLETVEPGIVPAPGTSLGVGLAKGLDAFVDQERRNKVLVLVSDGEDLEGEVDDAVAKAKEAGIVVHTVGVGTEAGEPVPEFDEQGRQSGYKRDDAGAPVVSRLNIGDPRGHRPWHRGADVPAHLRPTPAWAPWRRRSRAWSARPWPGSGPTGVGSATRGPSPPASRS